MNKKLIDSLDDAWLDISVNEEYLVKPLDVIFDQDPEIYIKKLTWLMCQPEYFSFVCLYVLGIKLLPFQAVVLAELWRRKFPMFVMTRGGGKSFLLSVYSMLRGLILNGRKIVGVGAAFRQSKVLFEYCEGIWNNAPVLRSLCTNTSGPKKDIDMCRMFINDSRLTYLPIGNGEKIRGQRAQDIISDEFACLRANTLVQTDYGLLTIKEYLNGEAYSLMNENSVFEYPDTIFRTPKVDVYKITTQYGYFFECSEKHKVKTQDGWKIAKDLTTKDRLEIDCNEYFPENCITKNDVVLDSDMGWLLGLLISEGSVTNRNVFSITNTDKTLIDKIKDRVKIDWSEDFLAAHVNNRGWDCKDKYTLRCHNTKLRSTLREFGLDYDISLDKKFPSSILLSPRDVVLSFLSGMYEGDGSCFTTSCGDREPEFQVVLYSSSYDLVRTTQILLLKFGVFSAINSRDVGTDNLNYRLVTRGSNASKLFKLLDVLKWKDIKPTEEIERKPQIRKSANGKRLLCSTTHGNRNKSLGTFDTEEECYEAFNNYWKSVREYVIVTKVEKLEEQEVLYDFHMPETHSFIGNGFVQHNSIPIDIFETVIAGFASVSASPSDNVIKRAKDKKAKELGIYEQLDTSDSDTFNLTNQIILSGTAYYDFNHFAKYWKKWKSIVESKGDEHKLEQVFNGSVPENFDWKEYSIIRIPCELLPDGFMDEGNLARSKATIHSGIYSMEMATIFTTDSQGFFKRSLIESCVPKNNEPVELQSGFVTFNPSLRGLPTSKYVFGVDPASEQDNFSIIVLEVFSDHRRIVHCWTTTRKSFQERRRKDPTIQETDFYGFCARKIRELAKTFPPERIAIDSQGGGVAVLEALHDSDKLRQGEVPFWPIIDPLKAADTDGESGKHIIEMCQFANYKWLGEANHGLRKDLEDKAIIFPMFDPVTIGLSIEDDKQKGRIFDTLEDCVMEIEELKNELSIIEIRQTDTGKDKWDTPEIKTGIGKKGRLRKDRYSALIMANMVARTMSRTPDRDPYESVGGFSHMQSLGTADKDFLGPAWWTEGMEGVY